MNKLFIWLWLALAAALAFAAFIGNAFADSPPRAALKHRADLVRISHATWGLDAPVAVFAAQIHQESGWNPEAVSHVGAVGMAQFMPATAKWWCEINSLQPAECQPRNPAWAIRAMIGYDKWLYERVRGQTEYDRLHAMLRSYNGGLGHWQTEAAKVRPAIDRFTVDAACGSARRAAVHCRENVGYPRRILAVLQQRYLTWGPGVDA